MKTKDRNVWILTEKDLVGVFQRETTNHRGFELTFMTVEENDLDEMAQYHDDGILPDHWNDEK